MKSCPKCNEQIKNKTKFCPSCGEKIGRKSTEEKKSRLTEKKKGGKLPLIAATAAVAIVAVIAVLLFRPNGTTALSTPASSSGAVTEMTFAVSTFDDGAPKYYKYDDPQGKEIRFFILKSSDGVIRAAFDACDVCYQSRKGYRQEGDFMVCNNCGQRFQSTRINEVKGGCNPAPLKREIVGDKLVIAVADINPGARYF